MQQKGRRNANSEPITSRTTWEMDNDRSEDTRIQQAIVHPVDMTSNRPIRLAHAPTEKQIIMRQRQSLTKWEKSLPIATLPNDGVGR